MMGARLRMLQSRQSRGGAGPLSRWRARPQASDDGAYQVDLVVAFFSILLVLFVVYSAQTYSAVTETSKLSYRPEDARKRPFRLRSFAPLYPYRDYWIVKDGRVAKLALGKIAEHYAAGKAARYEDSISGADVYLIPDEREATSFRLRLLVFEKGLPAWLVPEPASVMILSGKGAKKGISSEALARALSRQDRPVFFFIWHDQQERFAPVLQVLTRMGFPYGSITLERGSNEVLISIKGSDYGLHDILRAY